jgi:hypothetical protein
MAAARTPLRAAAAERTVKDAADSTKQPRQPGVGQQATACLGAQTVRPLAPGSAADAPSDLRWGHADALPEEHGRADHADRPDRTHASVTAGRHHDGGQGDDPQCEVSGDLLHGEPLRWRNSRLCVGRLIRRLPASAVPVIAAAPEQEEQHDDQENGTHDLFLPLPRDKEHETCQSSNPNENRRPRSCRQRESPRVRQQRLE